ncbi:hypothetical protein L6164_016996 [Bauhinia variegata]|uniref:Uncharacterized protein n=1 Tax=Bauhinia variegata TaxID=167791 RepID=A0ACB9N821_BAUVA|nr:hypothetical protein L6164_016996 [Bauhinia variegata]
MEFGTTTATLPKKLSNSSTYDGIFATPIKFRAPNLSSKLDDYCEIFGGSGVSFGSSIPILEIPLLDERKILDDIQRSKLEYSKVFGGFGNLDTAVPYEELFVEPKKVDSFPKEALRRANGENQSMKEDPANYVKENPLESQEAASVNVASKISMSYHKTNQGNGNGTNGTVQITLPHAVPDYTCLIEEVNPRVDMTPPVMPDTYPSTRGRERKKRSGHCTESVTGPSPDNVNEHSSNSGVKGHNKSDSIHLFFDTFEISHGSDGTNHIKVPPSETLVGHLDSENNDAARSVATKYHTSERPAGADSPSYLDDMVDSNSEAAASVAALRKAIEEAQERINIAKESMKRKKEGIPNRMKRRLNSNLKTEVKKESNVSNKTIRLEETDMWRTSADMDTLPQVLSEIGMPMMRAGQVIPDRRGKQTFVVKEAASGTQQKSKSTQHKEERVEAEWKEADHKATVVMFKQAGDDKKALNDSQWNEINKNRIACEKFEIFGQTIEKVDGAWDQNDENVNSSDISRGSKEFLDETKLAQEMLDNGVKDQRLTADEEAEETEEVASFHELADHEGKLGEQEITIEEKMFVCKQEEAETGDEVSWEVEEHQKDLRAHQENVEVEKEVAQEHKESKGKVEISCELEECGLTELLEPIDKETVLNPQSSDLKVEEIRIENWGCLEEEKKRKEADLMNMDQGSECSHGRESSENGFENIEVQKMTEEMLDHIHEEEEIQEKITQNGESDGNGKWGDAKGNEKELEAPIYLMEENEKGRKNNGEWVEVIRVNQTGSNYEEQQTKEADKPAETSPHHEQDETEELSTVEVADSIVQNNETLDKMLEECTNHEQGDINSNTSFKAEEKYKEPETVEERNDCGEKNTLETSSLTPDAFELSEAMSQMQNVKEAAMFDGVSIAVDEIDMKVVQNQDQCSKETEKDCNLAMLVEELTPESVEISEEEKEAEVALNEEIDEKQCDSSYEEKMIDSEQNVEAELPCMSDGESKTFKILESETSDSNLKENHQATLGVEEEKANGTLERVELEKKQPKKIDETKEREREREKEKLAVERAIREARERAFAEARERAVLERAAAEARRKNMSDGRESLGKTTGQPNEKTLAEKAAMEAKLKAERAAVERATAEARTRALERALSEQAASEARYKSENFVAEKSFGTSRDNGTKQRFYSKSFSNGDVFDEANGDSAQRCKARSERHQRIGERAAKALAEKNMRDLLVQKEQEERNRVAEALDADVKRWSSGKEGNLRALLSTLQYILGPDSGWQPIPLTDIVINTAVKKAYRKATLFVHPDKLQQRGASIQQKYTCEKVFDLLKEAWNRFNKEER